MLKLAYTIMLVYASQTVDQTSCEKHEVCRQSEKSAPHWHRLSKLFIIYPLQSNKFYHSY